MGYFDHSNSPLGDRRGLNGDSRGLLVLPYDDGFVVIDKSMGRYFRLLKYISGGWTTLISLESEDLKSKKEAIIFNSGLSQAMIHNDELYLAAPNGCYGTQRLNITKDKELTLDDHYVILDPSLPDQCVYHFSQTPTGGFNVLTAQRYVTKYCR